MTDISNIKIFIVKFVTKIMSYKTESFDIYGPEKMIKNKKKMFDFKLYINMSVYTRCKGRTMKG